MLLLKILQSLYNFISTLSLEEMLAEVEKSANAAPGVLKPKIMTPGMFL